MLPTVYLYLYTSHRYIYWCSYRWHILDSKPKDKYHPAPTQHPSQYPKKTRLVIFSPHFKIYFNLCISATYFHVPRCDLLWHAHTNSEITRWMCTKLQNRPIFRTFRHSAVEASALLSCYATYWVVVIEASAQPIGAIFPLILKMGLTCYT
jgi:hypothetical protein